MKQTTKNNSNLSITKQKVKNRNIIIKISLIAFILISLFLGWQLYNQIQINKELRSKLQTKVSEKEKLEIDLRDLFMQYEDLKTDNEKMNLKILKAQEKIKNLINEITHIKTVTKYQIAKYKEEIESLREILKSYIAEVDSLNTLNKQLTAENIKVKSQYKEIQIKTQQLDSINKKLSEKVEKASTILTENLVAIPINKRGNEKHNISKITKIKVCFTLKKNLIAKSGKRMVYLRIARPDELILAESPDNLFIYNGKKIIYSAKREINYQNKDTAMCIYWNREKQELIPGTYFVDIFMDGKIIGTTTFILIERNLLF